MMGGTARAQILAAPEGAKQLLESEGDRLERSWSRFIADSDLSRLNRSAGRPAAVSSDMIDLIIAMREGWRETDGQFDPTLLPDVIAAGYDRSRLDPTLVTTLPASARSRQNLDAIVLDGEWVTLPAAMTLDSAGIGKGLAADHLAAAIIKLGAWGCVIEVGGDVRVLGDAPDGIAWRIAVEDPFDTSSTRSIVRLTEGGIATSSQRKRRWGKPGSAQTHHLIDPQTQHSAATTVQTVTVLASTAARAETLTKPGFLSPMTDYLDWLPTRGAAGILIDDEGREFATDNWGDYA
jgi:thiamine biosynthesis lipoprotein